MRNHRCGSHPQIRDFGPEPLIFNMEHATKRNENFRTTIWTGRDLQLTLMSIPTCGEIGLEMHRDVDQFIRIVQGRARVWMGDCRDRLREMDCVDANDAIIIPAGTFHNIVNVGNCPLKLYSIYAPPQHPFGTVHKTRADAERDGH